MFLLKAHDSRDHSLSCIRNLFSYCNASLKQEVHVESVDAYVLGDFPLLLAAYYEALFQQCHQQYQGEGPTGMLLVYPEHVVHIMEGSWELVEAVIRDCCDSKDANRLVYVQFFLSLPLSIPPSFPPSLPPSFPPSLPPSLPLDKYFFLSSTVY